MVRIGKHPPGLLVLAGTELAERFSYYGMTGLLPLYMIRQLLLPEHADNAFGLAALRHVFEFRSTMSDQAFASLIFGWYGGLVYFTPLIGGLVADRWIGIKRAVVLGAVLMAAGHLAMSLDQTFLVALLLLIAGSGLLKGNISAQVGTLYPEDAESLRERGYAIYSTGINIGATMGPIATGTVAILYGWHAGFALAAVLMILALILYLAGSRHLPDYGKLSAAKADLPPLTNEEKARTRCLVGLILLLIPVNVAYPMIWNVGLVWIDQHVDLSTALGSVPAAWFNSVDSFSSIVVAPVLITLWAWQARRGSEPASMTKIAIGVAMTGASALILAAGALLSPDGHVSVIWPLLGWFGMGAAFMWYWPIALSLISKAAPAKVNSTLMGGAFLALFAGSAIMGWVGSFYDQMSNVAFWTLDASIALVSAIVIVAVKAPITRILGLGEA